MEFDIVNMVESLEMLGAAVLLIKKFRNCSINKKKKSIIILCTHTFCSIQSFSD